MRRAYEIDARAMLHDGMDKKQTGNFVQWAIAFTVLLAMQDAWCSATRFEPVRDGQFEPALAGGRIADVTTSGRRISGRIEQAMLDESAMRCLAAELRRG